MSAFLLRYCTEYDADPRDVTQVDRDFAAQWVLGAIGNTAEIGSTPTPDHRQCDDHDSRR